MASLSLEEMEEDLIQLGVESVDNEISYVNCFVAMFFTSSVVHFQAIRSTLANVWHPIGEVSISDLENGENPLTVQLTEVSFWILVNDIPHGFMFEVVAKQLGNFVGTFLEYDTSVVQLAYRGIIRLRVRLDVGSPSKRKKKLLLPNVEKNYGVKEPIAGGG
ncbi:hypothetical protein GOBAR_DD25479 [Gossypium barbadense]|nr:hypothetical protein GOBAR_DD25479 [Gossypium barbadense]